MSFNSNNPNQQWQQQQNQPSNPQATPASSSPPGAVNYQQSQQTYNFQTGNTQGQHHQSQQSWSWQGQTTTPAPTIQSPPIFPPPPMLLQNNDHHQLHQQMHQNAMSHSQQALSHHHQVLNMQQNMAQSMAQNMASMMSSMAPAIVQQTPQRPQIAYHSAQQQHQSAYQTASPLQQQQQQIVQHQTLQQPQIAYQTTSPQPQVVQQQNVQQKPQIAYQNVSHIAPQQQTQQRPAIALATNLQPQPQYQQGIYQQPQQLHAPMSQFPQMAISSPAASQPQYVSQQFDLPSTNVQPSQTQHMAQAPQTNQDSRFDELDKQRRKDVEDMNRAGAQISQRLRDLEQSTARAHSDQEAKDREVHRLQEQLAAVNRQRLQDAERNSQQLADLVRSQTASPSTQMPAFDMSALQKVIRETQVQRLSAADIDRVIEDHVSKRLSGMATKADIQNAGAQMQNALSQVPAGLNEQQVQKAVNRELNNVMQDVANRVNQPRRLAWQTPQDTRTTQTSQAQVQPEFVVEELPDDDDIVVHQVPRHDSTSQKTVTNAQTQSAGPAVAPTRTVLPQTSATNVAHQQMSHQAPDIVRSSQRPQYAAIEANPRGTSNNPALQPRSSAFPTSDTAGKGAIEAVTSISGTNQQIAGSGRNVYMPSGASGTSPIPIAQGQKNFAVQHPGGRLQQLALDAPSTQQAVSQSSMAVTRPGMQAQAAPSRSMQGALPTPSADPAVSKNTMTPVNMPASLAHGQNIPQSGYAARQIQAAMPQRQLEGAPASVRPLEVATRVVNPPYEGTSQVGMQQGQKQGATSYIQLEGAPVPAQQLQVAVSQPDTHQNQQCATQPRQIEAATSQRYLEAPATYSAGTSTAGNELVHQSRDVTRRWNHS